jgi:outer membrane protein assembly factor BamB
VQDGVVYAAAGIAHYDGTYVVALDAVTGKVKWYNDKSGTMSEKVNSGVSLQGGLAIRNNELQFEGGGVYQMARYDLETGKCLNTPHEGLNSRFATAFYPYFPEYAQYESVGKNFPDGKQLRYFASYEGGQHTNLALLGPEIKNPDAPTRPTDRPTDARRRRPQRKPVWQDNSGTRFKGFIMTNDVLLAAGVKDTGGSVQASLAAINIKDGTSLWRKELPSPVVKAGLAMDADGRIIATLENGQIVCIK